MDRLQRVIKDLSEPAKSKARVHQVTRRLAALGAAVAIVASATVLSVSAHHHAGSGGSAGRASSPAAESSPSTSTSPQARALAQWAGFPVHAAPRPIVLTGPALTGPTSGFANRADKLAVSSGNVVLDTTLPSSPPTANGWPVMPASDALTRVQGGPPGGTKSGAPARITQVKLDAATFSTDRGPQVLPSWRFTFAGIADPVDVLAIPDQDHWPHSPTPARNPLQLAITALPAERQATVSFYGAAPAGSGPCQAEYRADVLESTTAILVTIHAVTTGVSRATVQTCTADAHIRTLTVSVATAIGNRVFIDDHGAPLPDTAP